MDRNDRKNILCIWLLMIPLAVLGYCEGIRCKLYDPDSVLAFVVVGYLIVCFVATLMYAYLQGAFEPNDRS